MTHKINIILFGIGNAGSALINKALKNRKELILEKQLDFRFPVITNSTVAFYEKEGANFSWEANFIQFSIPFKMDDVVNFIKGSNLENVIVVDATPSAYLASEYLQLLKSGFSIVSINESLQFLPDNFEKGIRFLAETRELSHRFIAPDAKGKEAAGEALYKAILEIAEKQRLEII